MTTDRTPALEALLVETEAAHGAYETTELNGVYDQDWPRWYASYAVDHGIGAILGREMTAEELTDRLKAGWDEFERAEPRPDSWATYLAGRLAEKL